MCNPIVSRIKSTQLWFFGSEQAMQSQDIGLEQTMQKWYGSN